MSNYFRNLAGVMFLALSFSACRTPKTNLNYFSADKRDSSHTRIWQSYEARIRNGDKLSISISAFNPSSAEIYAFGKNGMPSTATVDTDGNIIFPQLGAIRAEGLTRSELRDILLNRLAHFVKDPVVAIEFANFKITVLGEVNRQGSIMVPDGRLTILEAIGQSGDITTSGQRDSVLIIRENSGVRQFGVVNLLSNEVFKSPHFVLHQNDIVYVPMRKSKAYVSEQDKKAVNFTTISSILSIITTLGFFIYNIIR